MTPASSQPGQLALFDPAPPPVPPVPRLLTWYDVILVNISGGKDSQAALDVTVKSARVLGVLPRVTAVFADLGDDDEWPGTADLAREHASHYGIRFELVRREVTGPDGTRRPQWLPVHAWTTSQVWDRISQAGTRPHPVYDQGMPRLSCRFCVLASRPALIRAARLDPEGAQRRADLEDRIGHKFRADLSMHEIIALARTAAPVTVTGWAA